MARVIGIPLYVNISVTSEKRMQILLVWIRKLFKDAWRKAVLVVVTLCAMILLLILKIY
ncbi:MAG: hypothetical protein ACP5RR_10075 [Candidatus Kapaibacteriota bacterium]